MPTSGLRRFPVTRCLASDFSRCRKGGTQFGCLGAGVCRAGVCRAGGGRVHGGFSDARTGAVGVPLGQELSHLFCLGRLHRPHPVGAVDLGVGQTRASAMHDKVIDLTHARRSVVFRLIVVLKSKAVQHKHRLVPAEGSIQIVRHLSFRGAPRPLPRIVMALRPLVGLDDHPEFFSR